MTRNGMTMVTARDRARLVGAAVARVTTGADGGNLRGDLYKADAEWLRINARHAYRLGRAVVTHPHLADELVPVSNYLLA